MNVHRWATDLVGVVLLSGLAVAVIAIAQVSWMPIRVALAVPLVLVLPGYALVSALFPEANTDDDRTMDGFERLMLSVALSLGIVPMAAFVLNFTPYGIYLRPILLVVVGWTVLFALVGLARRARRPADERFQIPWNAGLVPLSTYFSASRSSALRPQQPFEPRTDREVLLNVVLVASVVVLAISVGYAAFASPADDEQFTEYYMLAENETGELVADNDVYPTEFDEGESQPVHLAIENHEGETRTYTTVVLLQDVNATDGEGVDRTELDRFETTVEDGGTETTEYDVTPTRSGEMRVTFLLYPDDPPDAPTAENAAYSTSLRITVS